MNWKMFYLCGTMLMFSGQGLVPVRGADVADDVRTTLDRALQAEIDGEDSARQKLLDELARENPKYAAPNWHLGRIAQQGKWLPYDQAAKQAGTSKALEQYRKLRSDSTPTLESQLELADFCRRMQIKTQEMVHLTAVVELDPNHAEARRRLGQRQIDGQWLTPAQWQAGQEQAKAAANALRRRGDEYRRLATQLKEGQTTRDKAVERLAEDYQLGVVPVWEAILSSDSAEGAFAVLGALSRLRNADSTASLVRHAVFSPSEGVRQEATRELRKRPLDACVPPLLDLLRGPWISSYQWRRTAEGNLVCRYSLLADGQERQQLRVLDDVFYLRGFAPTADRIAANAAGNSAAQVDAQRVLANLAIDEQNQRVTQVLGQLSGEQTITSPQGWWTWWDDRNEVYSPDSKPLLVSYAFREAAVYGTPPPPPESGFRRRCECLAGGTPILTDRGPVAVDRIRMGDLVLAKNPHTGELAFKPVLRTTVRAPEPLVRLTMSGTTIRASGGHPFWVIGHGWTLARKLQPGMRLHGLTQAATIEQVEVEEKPARTYNMIVADFHSYFVGECRILSHDNTVRQPTFAPVPGMTATTDANLP